MCDDAWYEDDEDEAGGNHARYALVLEEGGLEFLMEVSRLWMPPRVRIRRGAAYVEIWLDEDDISEVVGRGFTPGEKRRLLETVRERLDELLGAWYDLKNDVRRGRLRKRHVLVD